MIQIPSEIIRLYVKMQKKAVLFGAGGVGLMAIGYFGSENVECFVDNNKQKSGTVFNGIPIISFDVLLGKYANNEDYRIYITSDIYYKEIAAQLEMAQVSNYSFFRDYIPDERAVTLLLEQEVSNTCDRIIIVGTNNISELIMSVCEKIFPQKKLCIIADSDDSSKAGSLFYGYMVEKKSELYKYLSEDVLIILTIPQEGLQNNLSADINVQAKTIHANEALAFQNREYLEYIKKYKKIDPKRIMSSERLDIIPRYLLFKGLINHNLSDHVRSLYARTILTWNAGEEKIGIFSPRCKKGVEEHISEAQKLIQSMLEKGYEQEKYIPLSGGIPLDGAHRMAASIALGNDIWVHEIAGNPPRLSYNWFEDNGFSVKDRISILRGFADIYRSCGILLLYSPAAQFEDYVLSRIKERLTIVGCVDLDFSDNFYAFENFINEIYHTYQGNSSIKRKIHFLKMYPLVVKVILVSDEKNRKCNLYGEITQLKLEIRDKLTIDIPAEAYCTIHGTDSVKEFEELKEVCLSHNNFNQLYHRVNTVYRKEFIDMLDELKIECVQKEIPIQDVCVVGGGVLEVMGIRETHDIDVIIYPKHKARIAELDGTKLSENVEVVASGYFAGGDADLNETAVIDDADLHFIFYGCKFANLELVKKRKESNLFHREKDDEDLRLIQIYEDFLLYFDEKEIAKRRLAKYMEAKQ